MGNKRITREMVEHVAMLARLGLSEEEKAIFEEQLDRILAYAEKINELDTSDVEPTSHVITLKNVMRDDEVKGSFPREEIIMNAPEKERGFFKVPKIVE